MSETLLDAAAIGRYLNEVADELPTAGGQRQLVVVGGALLAWHGLRESTRDVDAVKHLDTDIADAVVAVAERHDLASKWLNDSAAAFLPATFDIQRCSVLIERPTLKVLGLPWDELFLMKLNASRAVDTDDMEAIWPRCSFASAESAAEAFHEAYPLEQVDPHLADHIRRMVG